MSTNIEAPVIHAARHWTACLACQQIDPNPFTALRVHLLRHPDPSIGTYQDIMEAWLIIVRAYPDLYNTLHQHDDSDDEAGP